MPNAVNEIQKSLNAIEKALPNVGADITSPDDKTMINNIIEMLKQILGSGQGEMPEAAPVMEEIADTSEEMQVGKEKKAEGAIGDEGVDTRLEDQTPVTDNALQEIGKSMASIRTMLAGTVRKEKTNQQENAIMKSLQAVVGVMKGMADKQNQLETFMKSLVNNMGITDEIVQKAIVPPGVTTTPPGRPNQQADMMAFMTEFMKSMNQGRQPNQFGVDQHNPWNRQGDVRKSLDGVLDHLLEK